MGDRGWTTVGHADPALAVGRAALAEQEIKEREAIAAWDNDGHWPGIHKPLFNGPDAKRFDARLAKLDDLGLGAFGSVEKVSYSSVYLARKRIHRRRGFTIDDLRQEALTMRKLDHRHVVRLVAAYAPRPNQLCLLIWPAAVCNLSRLLEDLEDLRHGEGDRDDILDRFAALDLDDLSAIEPAARARDQGLDSPSHCPLEFLRNVVGCTARAMAYCHSNDVRHLDIKPPNILLKADRVYLADFGISRDVSGQDQTTTEGLPGTEKWRAPELYGDHGSSMQLSDIYSLGLVYLNIATVLYGESLTDFENALVYSTRQTTREEQLRAREEKLRVHLDKLTARALVTPPFMFTYEGQETVRPRPLVSLITRMVAPVPRNRPSADKIDEKLSMLGGIHQIYHGECCKQPISWVEDKLDRKFVTLANMRKENERQQRRIDELEGRDRTYEQRLENEHNLHKRDVSMLQTKLREAEERCRRLEAENTDLARRHGHGGHRGPASAAKRSSIGSPSAAGALGLVKTRSHPTTPAARPTMQQKSQSAQRLASNGRPSPATTAAAVRPSVATTAARGSPAERARTEPLGQRNPSVTSLTAFALRSNSISSRIPLPVTPGGRSGTPGTPGLQRDPSLTDSSMASSIFSRQSVETTPTPANGSPAIGRLRPGAAADENQRSGPPQWGRLPSIPPTTPTAEAEAEAETTAEPLPVTPPRSPALSAAALVGSFSAASSPRTLRSELASDGGDPDSTRRAVPSLQPMASWADVARRKSRGS